MTAPKEVLDLCEAFSLVAPQSLNEHETRVFYINHLFKSLGWAVDSTINSKEVRHEDRLQIVGESLKAPDYGFYLNNTLQFFVEAKKPSVNILNNSTASFQLRRYAWSAGLPISILTDFEELSIYDCRFEPKASDPASHARLMYIKYTDYSEKWSQLEKLIGKPAVENGSLRKYMREEPRGASPVDQAFLSDLMLWREELAADLIQKNTSLTETELRFVVQHTIDRIIFLRIAEDRGIERYGQLRNIAAEDNTYLKLTSLFRDADIKYNSGLFHFKKEKGQAEEPDNISLALQISDSVLRSVILSLYYPKPYAFAVIPPDILGRAYESFLGSIITVSGVNVTTQQKPEVRKAGGVYYTPQEIVSQISMGCIEPLISGLTANEALGIKILDPACGSGSFLIGAFRYLLDWHLSWHLNNPVGISSKTKKPHRSPVYRTSSGQIRLTISAKKRILSSCIFGVDIDPQAVEVTKLSLMLVVLEGEADQLQQVLLFHERALPDLSDNIKCGNSIITKDHSDAFDWKSEFREIFMRARPGFDIVIGNPPYVDSEWMSVYWTEWRSWCNQHYSTARGNWDFFCIFIELSLQLTRQGGYHSFIVPNKIGSAEYAAMARQVLANNNTILKIQDYSAVKVFSASVYPIVYYSKKSKDGTPKQPKNFLFDRFEDSDLGWTIKLSSQLDYSDSFPRDGSAWPIFSQTDSSIDIQKILRSSEKLQNFATILGGATVSEAYALSELITSSQDVGAEDLRILNSGTIDRNRSLWDSQPLRYLKSSISFPIVRVEVQHLLPPKRLEQARTPKLIVAGMTKKIECVMDDKGEFLAAKSTTIVIPNSDIDIALLGALLCSDIVSNIYHELYGGLSLAGGYLRIGPPQLRQIPIPRMTSPRQKKLAKQIAECFRKQQVLLQELSHIRVPQDRTKHERTCNQVHKEIELYIEELYGAGS